MTYVPAANRRPIWRTASVMTALILAILGSAAVKAADGTALLQNVARTYGMDEFYQVEKVVFTFNVKKGEDFISRTWIWWPRSTELMYVGPNADGYLVRSAFFRNELSADSPAFHRTVEGWFINDSFWLLFPLMAAWDDSVTVTDDGTSALPIGSGSARKLTVRYPHTDGRTGDAYVLYVGNGNRIVQWAYHPSGASQPKLVASWDEHTRMGPLLISLSHQDATGGFKLWFSNVVVTARKDAGDAIPTISEFTASRYRAESDLVAEYRRSLRAQQVAATTREQTDDLAARESAAREQADAARRQATELAAREAAAVDSAATDQAAREAAARRQAQLAEQRRQAELLAKQQQAEADRLAREREAAEAAALREQQRRQAELAQQQPTRTQVRQDDVTTAPAAPARTGRAATMVAGMDTEIDPDIVVRKDGGLLCQGVIRESGDLEQYIQAVAKRDRDAPVTIRLEQRYDARSYIVLMNSLRKYKMKNLVVINAR